jgi:predicted MFS family arabinose efflux permease
MTAPIRDRKVAEQVGASSALALAVSGSASVATAYGMARYGYGLLLPDIQDDLFLAVGTLGAIGSLAYVTYLLATVLVTRCIARVGERATVAGGGLLAVVGTISVAVAQGPLLLGLGVATAGASAGLVNPPFAEAVRRLPPVVRARTLATISCGTGWGVAVAAPIAIVAGDSWRTAYLVFAACAALSTALAVRTLRGRAFPSVAAKAPPRAPGLNRSAPPMVAGAILIGVGSAAFWTFAVDQAHDAGLDQTASRVLLGVAGVTSLVGMAAADLMRRCGARLTFVLSALLEAAAIVTLATAASSFAAVLLAAAVFGAAYNTLAAVSVLWGARIYVDHPSTGVATAIGAQGVGLLCGPVAGGILAQATSLTTALLAGAAVMVAAALCAPPNALFRSQADRHKS